jgi:D-proline reductase (dithiol) PrdB
LARLAELSRKDRLFVRTYPWRRIDPVPWTPLARPLSRCRVAVVSSAGLVPTGEAPFDTAVRGGDFSYRLVSRGCDLRRLIDCHRSGSFDHGGIAEDSNLALPLDRLEDLVASGRIGEVAPRHLSFMGSITAPGRLVRTSAPEAASILADDGVDAALLVPV